MSRLQSISLAIFMLWLALFAAFNVEHPSCTPVLSYACGAMAWRWFEEVILLHWLDTTLVTGLLAIVAAFVGGAYINAQMRQSEEHEKERRRRAHEATRSLLPLTLSLLSQYAKRAGDDLKRVATESDSDAIKRRLQCIHPPALPAEIENNFAAMIGSSCDKVGAVFSDLLVVVQVQYGRLEGHVSAAGSSEWALMPENIFQCVFDAALLHASAAILFAYARRQSDTVSEVTEWDDIYRSLRNMGYWPECYQPLMAWIDRKIGDGVSPKQAFSENIFQKNGSIL